jgi:DNA-binding transcriptional LysR family regulator
VLCKLTVACGTAVRPTLLHIAQPALSRQIKQLEAALGINLFDRAPRRVHLKIEGRHKAGFTPDVIAEMTQRPRVVSQVARGVGNATLVETMTHLCIGGTTFHRLIRPTRCSNAILFTAKIPHPHF